MKFTPPMVANGKVYAGTQNSLECLRTAARGRAAPAVAQRGQRRARRGCPGSILSLRGAFPAGIALDTASVTIGGTAARLLSANPAELILLVPSTLAPGAAAVTLAVGGRQIASGSLRIQPVAPGISMGEQGRAAVEVESVPAGGQIAIYLTGLGASTNVSARVGNKDARVVFAGQTSGYPGLNQVNLVVPEQLTPGDYPVLLIVDGIVSNSAIIRVR